MKPLLTLTLLCPFTISLHGATLLKENFDDGGGWGANSSSADTSADFGYDYSADGIPEAPHSEGGDAVRRGVKFQANIVDPGGAAEIMIYPVGQSFSGNYTLRFDAWVNYDADERINGGSAGTTEFIGGGIGYDGVSNAISTGFEILVTNDGGSGSDWRAFTDGAFVDAADMEAGSRNGFEPYYADFLPGMAPPGAQAQAAFPAGVAGSPGFQWVTYEMTRIDDRLLFFVEKPNGDRLKIVERDASSATTDGNINIHYADLFSSVSPAPNLTFGLVDNVVVSEAVPEPSSSLLLFISGVMLLRRSRK